MRIEDLKETLKRKPHFALILAALFHLIFTFSIFAVGRLGVASMPIDRDGIGGFATDGYVHKPVMDALADNLKRGELRSWINTRAAFQVKIFSLSALVTRPLVGSNILTIEPLNLIYYLAILTLTFTLARLVAGSPAAWLASLMVGVWPSLVLHSTQFLRDPLVIIGVLMLITLLALVLKQTLNWRQAALAVAAGAGAIYLAQVRQEIWLVLTVIVLVATLLLLLKCIVNRTIFTVNLLVITSLFALSIGIRGPGATVVSNPLPETVVSPTARTASPSPSPTRSSIWGRVAYARENFIEKGRGAGSAIDETVHFNSLADVLRYVPRALVIGYFAPFPARWFRSGGQVGLGGKILSSGEMILTYLFEALACLFIWQNRRQFTSWLLLLATVVGMLALGLVVTNIGTLYRIRYPFWILLVIMAGGAIVSWKRGSPAAG